MGLGAHGNVAGQNVAVSLDNAEHHGLVIMPDLVLTPEEAFVDFDRLAGSADRKIPVNVPHVLADQIAHAPRRFVRDAKLALNLFGGDAIPGGREQEHDEKPVPQRCPRALKGRPGSGVHLIAAMLASEAAAFLDPVIGRLLLALEAGQPLAEPDPHQMGQAAIVVREAPVKRLNCGTFNRHSQAPSENGHYIARFFLTVHRGYMRSRVLAPFHIPWSLLNFPLAPFEKACM